MIILGGQSSSSSLELTIDFIKVGQLSSSATPAPVIVVFHDPLRDGEGRAAAEGLAAHGREVSRPSFFGL